MINLKYYIVVLLFSIMMTASSKEIISVKLKSVNGHMVDTKTFIDSSRPVLIVFFAICCSTSLNALDDIHNAGEDLIEKHNLKIILISIDDVRNSKRVAPLLKSKGYDYDIYLDENGDFRRVMGVIARPHFILYDSMGNSIYERSGSTPGIEEEILTALEEANNE